MADGVAVRMDVYLDRLPNYLAHLGPSAVVPSAWNTKERSANIEVAAQGLQVAYKGRQAHALRARVRTIRDARALTPVPASDARRWHWHCPAQDQARPIRTRRRCGPTLPSHRRAACTTLRLRSSARGAKATWEWASVATQCRWPACPVHGSCAPRARARALLSARAVQCLTGACVGVAEPWSPGLLPGWEPNSFGYHADDGNAFNQTGSGRPYGPTYTTGDVVGCGVNFLDGTVFYTKNSQYLGTHRIARPAIPDAHIRLTAYCRRRGAGRMRDLHACVLGGGGKGVAFRDVKGALFPTVGMRTVGEVMLANFGQKPFVFDIDAHFQVPLPPRARGTPRPAARLTWLCARGVQAPCVPLRRCRRPDARWRK